MRRLRSIMLVSISLLSYSLHQTAAADRVIQANLVEAPEPDFVQTEVRDFDVRVDDKVAGSHRLMIQSNEARHEVSIQTDVKMDFIVYAYVFKFRGKEVWRDGKLEQVSIQCDDAGKKRTFQLKSDGKLQQVSFNGKQPQEHAISTMTTAYWKLPAADARTKPFPIVDVDTGTVRTARLTLVGPATVTAGQKQIDCQHFKIDGPSPAELWFDQNDCLVRQKSVEQGHSMELRLKKIHLAQSDSETLIR